MKHGKKYVDSAKLIDRAKLYDTTEALELCVKTGSAKFDESVEVHVKLGVDSRHADQQVRGAIVLPNGTGKSVRVVAICKGDNEKAAQAAGAEYVGAEELVQKIQNEGWVDFDVLITTPDMMLLLKQNLLLLRVNTSNLALLLQQWVLVLKLTQANLLNKIKVDSLKRLCYYTL